MTAVGSVFIAAPFKASCDPQTGEIAEALKQRLIKLTTFFRQRGFSIHNAHEREGWGRHMMTPEECTFFDFRDIKSCEWFVALPGNPASPGTHVELGWASAFQKRIVVLLEMDKEYAFLVRGLYQVADVQYVYFKDDEDCLAKLAELFPLPELRTL